MHVSYRVEGCGSTQAARVAIYQHLASTGHPVPEDGEDGDDSASSKSSKVLATYTAAARARRVSQSSFSATDRRRMLRGITYIFIT